MDNANKIQDMYESYELEVEDLELQGTRKLAETIIIYKNKNNTLNKGIDELIEKYENEINKCDCDTCITCQTYHKVIKKLKKLKGE